MSILTKRSFTTIRELLGNHRNLHAHLEALYEERETSRDVDIILEELEYYIQKEEAELKKDIFIELQEAIQKLRNN